MKDWSDKLQEATKDASHRDTQSAYMYGEYKGKRVAYVAPANGYYGNWDWNKSIIVDVQEAYDQGYQQGQADTPITEVIKEANIRFVKQQNFIQYATNGSVTGLSTGKTYLFIASHCDNGYYSVTDNSTHNMHISSGATEIFAYTGIPSNSMNGGQSGTPSVLLAKANSTSVSFSFASHNGAINLVVLELY